MGIHSARLVALLPPALLLLLLHLTTAAAAATTSTATTSSDDTTALIDLRNALGSPRLLASWRGSNPCGDSWYYINCSTAADSHDTQRVTKILLPNSGLNGTIPTSIGKLTALTYLDLSGNNLNGTVPDVFGNLAQLSHLDLHTNQLSGPFPATLTNLSTLLWLDFTSNILSGPLPVSMGGMSGLFFLGLSDNRFTGSIPASIGSIKGLAHLHAEHNQFSGPIAPALGSLPKLVHFIVNGNQLTGVPPAALSGLTSLEVLWLQDNHLTGSLPPEYGTLASLTELVASHNNLTGPIPASYSQLSMLSRLDLSYNNINGSIPSSLPTLSILLTLNLSSNSMVGTIPEGICSSGYLASVDLSFNTFAGPLPSTCYNLQASPNLQTLYLNDNQFTGTRPSGGTNMELRLWDNPWCAGNSSPPCQNPAAANASTSTSNQAISAPDVCAAACPVGKAPRPVTAAEVAVAANATQLCYCSLPMTLRLNLPGLPYLSSTLATTLQKGVAVKFGLQPAQVEVVGQCTFGSPGCTDCPCAGLCQGTTVTLYLLPLTGTQLSSAMVTQISDMLAPVKNNCSQPASDSLFLSSAFIPYYVIDYTAPGASTQPSPSSGGGGGGSGTALAVGVAVPLVVVAALVAVGVVAFVYWRKRQKRKAKESKPFFTDPKTSTGVSGVSGSTSGPGVNGVTVSRPLAFEPLQLFSLDELQAATENFADKYVIGRGGFGNVYYGELEDGTKVAVKQLSTQSRQGQNEFRAEVQAMGLSHPNLVRLIGYCSQFKERLLVYELMMGGNLNAYLRNGGAPGEPSRLLNWETRLKIAMDAARGMKYLHEEVFPPIIHRDLKAPNILLTETLEAKVADFGLARLFDTTEDTHVSTRIVGTLGYLDPCYGTSGQLTKSSDVYSLGVVFLELLSGRVAVDRSLQEHDKQLLPWVRKFAGRKDFAKSLVDPYLKTYPLKALQMWATVSVAMVETDEPDKRPTMGKVVEALSLVGAETQRWVQQTGGSAKGQPLPSKLLPVDMNNAPGLPSLASRQSDQDSGATTRTGEGPVGDVSGSTWQGGVGTVSDSDGGVWRGVPQPQWAQSDSEAGIPAGEGGGRDQSGYPRRGGEWGNPLMPPRGGAAPVTTVVQAEKFEEGR